MITYETIILSEEDQKKIFGKTLTFKNGFVDEPKLDWWNLLETYWVQPLVSIRPSGRESWNEIIAIFAKGFINRDNTRVLDYGYNTEDYKAVLSSIFAEADNDEYEVFENYAGACSKKVWKEVEKWVHETY